MTPASGVPALLIIGAQKSGTTTLLHVLRTHPGLWLPDREPHYFSHRWDRGPSWYAEWFRDAGDRAAGEKSTSYLTHPDTPARIATVAPDATLVAILRDPVDRAYSHYWHNRRLGKEPLEFSAAIEAEEGRLAGASPLEADRVGYLAVGRYERHLERFERAFPPAQLHVLLLDDLRRDPASATAPILESLGVEGAAAAPVPAGPAVRNAYVEYRSQRLRRVARRLPGPVAAAVYRLNRRDVTYAPMDPGLRRELASELASTRAAIGARLGREVPWTSG